jgi:hypothetical protein
MEDKSKLTEDQKLKRTRRFRRLRYEFKADLAAKINAKKGEKAEKAKLSRADRVLIDQCALLSLRAQQMRDDILSGEKEVSDEDLVRGTNAAIRAMKVLEQRKAQQVSAPLSQLLPAIASRQESARTTFEPSSSLGL